MYRTLIFFTLAFEWFIAALLILWICKSPLIDKVSNKIIDFFSRFRKD